MNVWQEVMAKQLRKAVTARTVVMDDGWWPMLSCGFETGSLLFFDLN